MVAKTFDYDSPRAQKARINNSIGTLWLAVATSAALALVFSGLALVALAWPIGWALIGLSMIPAMIIEWTKGELRQLRPSARTASVESVLDGNVLGALSKSPSPYEVATIVGRVYGGYFFSARFGISNKFLQEISSQDPSDMNAIWNVAQDIRKKTKSDSITAGMLVVALVQAYPTHEQLLAHVQLEPDDLIEGVRWQQRIAHAIDRARQPRRTGGIARDWSFGWIPLLSRFGQNLSEVAVRSADEATSVASQKDALGQLLTSLGSRGSGSAALIGPHAVGKTQLVYQLADILLDAKTNVPSNLRFHQVFMLDAASLIAAAPGRGELEDLMSRLINEAFRAKNVVLCLDDAQLFFEEGVGSVDLSNVLLPVLQAGRLPIILTMDDQRFLQINGRNPQLGAALSRIIMQPTSKAETLLVMQDQVDLYEYQQGVVYMYQALAEAYRLGERYMHDMAMPGKALKVLQAAGAHAEGGIVSAVSVQQAIEKTMGVKVGVAGGDEERDKLLNLEKLIHERMINQTKAVSAVSDALRRARAGVRNQNRPIGTFMFLGPTGVGKTELAKALADVYFGGVDHMIRLDMNEFVSSNDVSRLIADASDDSSSLTAQVMKKPFSVILLDEIEKAHPNVLTTFLQVLDEGILRDVKNREVSFRDAIIIATSNAGADRIREYIERGMDADQFEDQFIDELISSNQFKPEFLNRFDEIVMFRPLKKAELLQVVDLILADINKTLALQKVSVTVSQEAKEYLVDAGYDPRLGARPMRRVVQRAVENTVAKQVLGGDVEAGGTVEITLEQVRSLVKSKQRADEIVGGDVS